MNSIPGTPDLGDFDRRDEIDYEADREYDRREDDRRDDGRKIVAIWENKTGGKVKVHASGCPMLKSANRQKGRVPLNAEELADMRQRGYPIVKCKCTKEE